VVDRHVEMHSESDDSSFLKPFTLQLEDVHPGRQYPSPTKLKWSSSGAPVGGCVAGTVGDSVLAAGDVGASVLAAGASVEAAAAVVTAESKL